MTLVLSPGIRKNRGTRICLPQAPRLPVKETLPHLAPAPAPHCLPFNRPWMSAQSLQQALALWADHDSHKQQHQLACQFIRSVQGERIDVAGEGWL